jgi:hypothetical protein
MLSHHAATFAYRLDQDLDQVLITKPRPVLVIA